jgi:RimJ/RimL family protein N-acetyltransferase
VLVFASERLIVRELQDEDLAAFHALCSDPAIVEYMGDGEPLTLEQTQSWLEISKKNYQKQGFGCFAITSRENGQLIGFGGLVHPPGNNTSTVEIIYAFKQSCWGQGLASEFARAMVETGFQRWHLPSIEASIDPANKASLRVMQKIGMHFLRSDVDENDLPTEYYAIQSGEIR